MLKTFTFSLVQGLINRVIDCDNISREQLNQLQGQLLRIQLASPQMAFDIFFDDQKIRLEPSLTSQIPTATLKLDTAVQGLQLLKRKDDEFSNIPIEGNYQLLLQLQRILKHSQFDLTSTISPFVGHYVANTVGQLNHLSRYTKHSLDNAEFFISDLLKNESDLFAYSWQIDDLQQSLLQLNQRIDRLNAKLDQAINYQQNQ